MDAFGEVKDYTPVQSVGAYNAGFVQEKAHTAATTALSWGYVTRLYTVSVPQLVNLNLISVVLIITKQGKCRASKTT